jgi:hypothetical protein
VEQTKKQGEGNPGRKRFGLGLVTGVTGMAAVALVVLAGCTVPKNLVEQDPETQPKVDKWTYVETGEIVTFVVDVRVSREAEDLDYLPLEVGIANRGKRELGIGRESFVLVDDEGREYPMAGIAEVREAKLPIALIQLLGHFDGGYLAFRYPTWPRVETTFFPVGDADPRLTRYSVRKDDFLLRSGEWFWDLFYFPKPEGFSPGTRYRLVFKAEPLEVPIVIRFRPES